VSAVELDRPVALAPAAVPAIKVAGLARSYGSLRALDDVSFSIPKGSLCGLIGPNGAGKTTLLSILATLDDDFYGDAFIAGRDVRDDALGARRAMGFVPDYACIQDSLTVREYLRFFAGAMKLPVDEREAAVDDALKLSGLTVVDERPADGLSKGMTQRLNVARALLHDPDVLILDEPASGLDPRARIELKQLLKGLKARGKTVLISSHILTELGDFCDTIIVLERGKVVASGALSDLWTRLSDEGGYVPRRVVIEVERAADRAEAILERRRGVLEVSREGCVLACLVQGPRRVNADLVRALVEAGIDVVRAVPERENLEALFLTVTRGELQ
jgi:ABC-2 type transport system ATP-binding protein